MADPTPKSAQELKTYHGNCHCGAFKFTIKLPELKKVTECNCSICFKKGYKWLFPKDGEFTVEKGAGSLTEYEFGQKASVHKFCPTCGTPLLQERKDAPPNMRYAVNARALIDVDLWPLEVVLDDGTRRAPKYVPAFFDGSEPSAEVPNPKIYTGACHCGAVTLAMKARGPLPAGGEYIQECDCSICTRFCSTCGISIYIERKPITAEDFAKWHPSSKYENWLKNQAVNLRLFEGIEWKEIEIKKAYWSKSEPKYVCPT